MWASGGSCALEFEVTRGPAHAGRLRAWERVAFATIFVLMVGFVAGVTVLAMRAGRTTAQDRSGLDGGSSSELTVGSGHAAQTAGGGSPDARGQHAPSAAVMDSRLAAALRPVLARNRGHVSVGVIDASTGARALYDARRSFHTASIVKADILATLLLRDQQAGTGLTDQQAGLVVPMIEESDDQAATDLWQMVGGTEIATANARLGLSHTVAGPPGYWGLTRTTVADQLRLLSDLTSATSPLTAASRDYEIGLMEDVTPSQQWGVSAAASPGSVFAVKDGWLPDPDLWVINSIGIVTRDGQRLLIAVLSNDQSSEAAGIAADSAAALAAARVITAAR
jgi:Beta-lactamase enzyme family